METDKASPGDEAASSIGASFPVQDASQPTFESQEASWNQPDPSSVATGMLTEGEGMVMTGEALEAAVMEIVALGFTKDQASVAMAASCNDPNRAVDYLLSGTAGVTSEVTAEKTSESREEFSFPVIAEDVSSEAADPLLIFASQPQFSQIRHSLSSNAQMLESFLHQVRRTNPRLHKAISENRERFLQTLNEPIAAEDLGGGGGGAVGFGSIVMSQTEHQAVEQLMALGFSQSLCVQAYFACEKNENYAADFLLSQDLEELN